MVTSFFFVRFIIIFPGNKFFKGKNQKNTTNKLTHKKLKNINIEADMGDIEIGGEIEGNINIEADMGNVDIEGYLLGDIFVDADMGDVDICTYYNEKYYNNYRRVIWFWTIICNGA